MVLLRARGAQSARVPIGTPLGIERYGRKLRSTGSLDVVLRTFAEAYRLGADGHFAARPLATICVGAGRFGE